MLLVAAGLALGCGGESLNEPDPNNPQEPNNPDVPALPARTDLGTLGGESSYAYDINDNGVVVGESQTSDGTYRGFRWTLDGGLQPLPPLSGDQESRALAVANDDRPLGQSIAEDGTSRPVLWTSDGTPEELPIPPIPGAVLTPNDRNAQGTVAGDAFFVENPDVQSHAWVWIAASGLTDLSDQLNEQFASSASAVGDGGHVVGTLREDLRRAYVWHPQSGAQELGVPGSAPERTDVTAQAVNGAGDVAGRARLLPPESEVLPEPEPPFPTFGSHAYVWRQGGGFTLLPGFEGNGLSEAIADDLNDRGDVVGSATPSTGETINAVAWPRAGAIVLLNGSDLNTSVAFAVNSMGVAVGWTSTSSEGPNRATVWNIDLATPLTARMTRPGAAASPKAAQDRSGTTACLEQRDRLISKAQLADCLEGRTR